MSAYFRRIIHQQAQVLPLETCYTGCPKKGTQVYNHIYLCSENDKSLNCVSLVRQDLNLNFEI